MADFLTDLFSGVAGTHLENHTPNLGGAWHQVNFTIPELEANLNGSGKVTAVLTNATSTCGYYNDVTPPSADYRHYFTMTVGDLNWTDDCFVAVRSATSPITTSYSFGFVKALARWELRRGTTTLASQSVTLTQGDVHVIECRAVGTTITGWVDGVQILSAIDATFPLAGLCNIYLGGSGPGAAGQVGYSASNLHAEAFPFSPAGCFYFQGYIAREADGSVESANAYGSPTGFQLCNTLTGAHYILTSPVVDLNGAQPGENIRLKIRRDADNDLDTATDSISLVKVAIEYDVVE